MSETPPETHPFPPSYSGVSCLVFQCLVNVPMFTVQTEAKKVIIMLVTLQKLRKVWYRTKFSTNFNMIRFKHDQVAQESRPQWETEVILLRQLAKESFFMHYAITGEVQSFLHQSKVSLIPLCHRSCERNYCPEHIQTPDYHSQYCLTTVPSFLHYYYSLVCNVRLTLFCLQ